MIDSKNLYVGIIIRAKNYYNNIKVNRYFGGINYDPFLDEDDILSRYIGIPTIVLKNNNGYEDLLFSRFKGEVTYKLNEFNNLGIKLIHLEEFTKYYPDYTHFPMIYEVANDIASRQLQDYMPYLLFPYETTDGFYIILNNDAPLDDFYYEYRINFHSKKLYNIQKAPKYKKLVFH